MYPLQKPFLIVPKLVEQPTWGGNYIVNYKNWQNNSSLSNKIIGQSYELYGNSQLAVDLTDSSTADFSPEGLFRKSVIPLTTLVNENASSVLGEKISQQHKQMPLLIKFTQALGNSFQLHVKQHQKNDRWKPKAESWYYFEDGLLTFGIKKGIDLQKYKEMCLEIDKQLHSLSEKVLRDEITLDVAKETAKSIVKEYNPWQFVNVHEAKKDMLIDLSLGGIHHSWEENRKKYSLGNIVYEVQQDVPDDECTIRSFDQGKIKDDGTIRKIAIEDYFQFADIDEQHNDLQNSLLKRKGNTLLSTPFYSLDILEIENKREEYTLNSFQHLFVREGDVQIKTKEGEVRLTKGHSCFIPYAVNKYEITANKQNSIVLKTYIE